MNPLSHALSHNGNNFDLVRLLAAIAVVYGHSYVLQAPDGTTDWVQNALGFDGFGALGVYAFFLLSGMLVTASFDRQRSVPRFAVLRIARLWPAVAAGSLVTVFIVGPLFTTLTLREYFASGMTWANLDNFSTIVLSRRLGAARRVRAQPLSRRHLRTAVDAAGRSALLSARARDRHGGFAVQLARRDARGGARLRRVHAARGYAALADRLARFQRNARTAIRSGRSRFSCWACCCMAGANGSTSTV